MTNDVLHMIEENMASFSKGQKRIAACILSDCDTAAFMTAGKLGRQAQVSESTVVRFAAVLGYDGYPQLQRALQERVRSKLTATQGGPVSGPGNSGADMVGAVFQTEMDRLRRAAGTVDRGSFDAMVEGLLSARHIYILGVRSSAFLAEYLHFYLRMIFANVTLITSSGTSDVLEDLLHIGPGDLLVAISFPRYAQATVQGANYARRRGAQVAAVTDSEESPLFSLAASALLAPGDMISFVDSPVVPFSLLNALILATGHRKRDNITQSMGQLEGVWEEYGAFRGKYEN